MNILPIIVLYNVDYLVTNVYRSLLIHYEGTRILIYENSPEPQNSHYESGTVMYHHDKMNGGVSAAYNYGAALAKACKDIDAILLLDEDTQFQPDYLDVLDKALKSHPDIDLFVPQVIYAKNLPFSPVHRRLRKDRGAFLSEGVYSLKDYLPVNSGACLRLSAFDAVGGYNPKIRLDFADFDFFSRMAEVSEVFYLVNSTAYQAFSNEETQVDKLFRRYQFYLEGAHEAKLNKLISTSVKIETLRHTLALSWRTRSMAFLIYLLHHV